MTKMFSRNSSAGILLFLLCLSGCGQPATPAPEGVEMSAPANAHELALRSLAHRKLSEHYARAEIVDEVASLASGVLAVCGRFQIHDENIRGVYVATSQGAAVFTRGGEDKWQRSCTGGWAVGSGKY